MSYFCACIDPYWVAGSARVCGACGGSLGGEPLGYDIPIYGPDSPTEDPSSKILDYGICEYCDAVRRDHVGEDRKCPFAATNFKQLIAKRWYK